MRYLSLFSGIEAATVAWHPLGWMPVGFAEIEPFPCAVLEHHYPDVPNLGCVTDITEAMIKQLGPIDLVVFGSPCQDLSVAGKRKGFDGERSGLFFAAIQIIRWARKHGNCRFALWENVPGAFSSNQGKDFAEVLRLLTGTDQSCPEQPGQKKWRYAGVSFGKEGLVEWRVCDAQFYGVPQRRRRVFALADFGDWTRREPILFESESLLRDSEPGAEAWEESAPEAGTSIEAGGLTGNLSAYDMTAFGQYGPGKTSSTLKQRDYKDATDLVVFEPGAMSRLGGHWSSDLSPCLRAHMGDNHPTIAFNPKDDPVHSNTVAMTLQAQGNGLSAAVAIPIHDQATRHSGKRGEHQDGKGNGLGIGQPGDPMNTLTAGDKHAVASTSSGEAELAIRRLTPVECERLQGFPDGYSAIPWKNKPAEECPDGPRYKALGNSMAVPVMRWIGNRIQTALS
ncbi:DNA cytosine methyltransferase [Endozoicomonas sp. SCSIO W0465]|uniref:DNA cytosine methyltransferase n=1 Tax=Endozoicomonas sp. SCSIO W0465 TaxID=2918516 RepID=UPI00207616F0|nr:DNA cytosine methyltransferase [Endozoicomonas sp. SCSIO W0465]USE34710.1 DNA cytosine methyltransferase [Endozoicomonas sp. SCSIO W0465]